MAAGIIELIDANNKMHLVNVLDGLSGATVTYTQTDEINSDAQCTGYTYKKYKGMYFKVDDLFGIKADRMGAKGNAAGDDTVALQNAIKEAYDQGGIVLLKPKGVYNVSGLLIDNPTVPITLYGYGATLVGLSAATPIITIGSGDNNIFGLTILPKYNSGVPISATGISMINKSGRNTTYNVIRDVKMKDIYKGIDSYMSVLTGGWANYRNQIQNCEIENSYLPKTWTGSFGISFSGVNAGDSAGNDSKITDVKLKGYEKNIIIKNSTTAKIRGGSIDGALIGIELDNSSLTTLTDTYIEYNTTAFNFVNNPYRLCILNGTIAGYTTKFAGTMLFDEVPLEIGTTDSPVRQQKSLVDGNTDVMPRLISAVGGGFWMDVPQKYYDFRRVKNKFSLISSPDIDLYHSIGVGKKHYFGNLLATSPIYGTIDENGMYEGDIKYGALYPTRGVVTVASGTTSPDVGTSSVYITNNSTTTGIVRFDFGKLGYDFKLIVNDNNTVISANANLILLHGTGSRNLKQGEVLQFVCIGAAADMNMTYQEIGREKKNNGTRTVTGTAQTTVNIPHGLGVIPSFTMVIPKSLDAVNAKLTWTEDITNIIVTVLTPNTGGSLVYAWEAKA